MSIYKIVCSDNHFYIGSTRTPLEIRMYHHYNSSKKVNTKLYNHIRTIGWENTKSSIIETCDNYKQRELELILLEKGNPLCLNTRGFLSEEDKRIRSNKLMKKITLAYYYRNKDRLNQERKVRYHLKKQIVTSNESDQDRSNPIGEQTEG